LSTTTVEKPATQKEHVLAHLQDKGAISPWVALGVYGIFRLASRIDELRQEGYEIQTNMKKDARGKRYAEYVLA